MALRARCNSPRVRFQGSHHVTGTVYNAHGEREGGREADTHGDEHGFGDDAFWLEAFFCEVEGCVEAGEHELRCGQARQEGDAVRPAVGAIDEVRPDIRRTGVCGGADGTGYCDYEEGGEGEDDWDVVHVSSRY